MPQLDIYNIFSQLFWCSFFFFTFYFFIVIFVVPTLFSMIFSRSFFLYNNQNYYKVSFFTTVLYESSVFDFYIEPTIESIVESLDSSINSYLVYESCINEKIFIY